MNAQRLKQKRNHDSHKPWLLLWSRDMKWSGCDWPAAAQECLEWPKQTHSCHRTWPINFSLRLHLLYVRYTIKKTQNDRSAGLCWGEKQWFLYVTFSRADTYEHARWCKGWSGGFFLRWIMNHESRDASFPEVQVAAKARSLLFYMTNCS